MKRKLLLTIVCMTISAAAAQMMYAEESPITPDGTYLYAERDTCDLYLDVYNPAKGSQTSIDGKKKPTIVFMFPFLKSWKQRKMQAEAQQSTQPDTQQEKEDVL